MADNNGWRESARPGSDPFEREGAPYRSWEKRASDRGQRFGDAARPRTGIEDFGIPADYAYEGRRGLGRSFGAPEDPVRRPNQAASWREEVDERGPREPPRWSRERLEEPRSWWGKTRDEISAWLGDDDAARRRQSDSGPHRGVAPKGYVRSDDRIRDDVCDRLTDDPLLDPSRVEVAVSGAEVTLGGLVGAREDRRRAEDIAEAVAGVRHVQNNLRVDDRAGSLWGAAATSGAFGSTSGEADGPIASPEL